MRLVYVFMALGESRLVAGVDDGAGKLRRIETKWEAKADPHLPPPMWAETVRGEAEFQRNEDAHSNPVRKYL